MDMNSNYFLVFLLGSMLSHVSLSTSSAYARPLKNSIESSEKSLKTSKKFLTQEQTLMTDIEISRYGSSLRLSSRMFNRLGSMFGFHLGENAFGFRYEETSASMDQQNIRETYKQIMQSREKIDFNDNRTYFPFNASL